MKLVIELPDKVVEAIQNGEDYRYDIHTVIAQSTPYNPSGDLISRSDLEEALKSNCKPELCHDYNTAWCESCCPHNDFEDLIDNAPTVEPICPYLSDNEVKQPCLNSPCERPQGKWGKWVISEIQCPNCLEYFQTDCYSMEELKKCPVCGEDMQKGGAE